MAGFGSSLSVDLSRFAAICEEEWLSFLDDVNLDPIPERQDLRGFFLNWVAVFMPEAFPSSLTMKMAAWVEEFQATDGTLWGFAKPPLIGAALFALTNNQQWLKAQFRNFSYGGSQLRNFLHKTLALVAPRISFDSELTAQLSYGMKIPYFMMDTPLVLYAVSKGDFEQKLTNLKIWRESYFMNSAEQETVDRFLKGDPARNPLEHWLLRNTSYVALRIGCYRSGTAGDSEMLCRASLSDVWDRVNQHPLFSSIVWLTRPDERDSNSQH